jgi:hypothetical protein
MASPDSTNSYATKMPRLWKMIASILNTYKLPLSVTPPGTYIRD